MPYLGNQPADVAVVVGADAVGTAEIEDLSVDTADIANNAVTTDKMAALARGKIIYGDASGDPQALALGTDNHVLTVSGSDINWEATQSSAAAAGTLTGSTLASGVTASSLTSTGTIAAFRSTGIDDNADALAMTIDSSENVGIGTASPATALHVASGAVDALTVASSVDGCKINMKDSGSTAGIDLYADDENFGLYVNDALKFYIGSTGAFSMGSNLQFSEAARGTLNNISHDNFQTLYTATFDGSWMVVCRISDGDGASFFVFHRTNSGGTRRVDVSHEHQCDGRWDGDKIEISQFTGGGSLDIPYVIYRIL